VDVVIGWRTGREAVTHDVYLSTDEQAVIDGTAPVVTLDDTIYGPDDLALITDYFWKVAEVNETETPSKWESSVWNFTTSDHIVLDDFESYNDIPAGDAGSNLVYIAWQDGFDNPNANGSTIGYVAGESMESGNVHGGKKSVPFQYNNTKAGVSEVTLNLMPAQDWTAHGVITLSLWFAGDTVNIPGQLYVKVNGVQVNYDSDASNLIQSAWQVWNIDLTTIGTNLSNVNSLAVGIQGSGATGTLLLDDIRLYPYPRQLVTPAEPDPVGLVAHYPLDGNANDSAGNANGTLAGGQYVLGKLGQAVSLAGTGNDYVDCGNPSQLDFGTGSWTVSAWVNAASTTAQMNIFGKGGDNSGGIRYMLSIGETDDHMAVLTVDDNVTKVQKTGSVVVDDGQWHHVVGIRDDNGLRVFVDGFQDGEEVPLSATYDLSGTSQANAYIGAGWNFDTSVVQKFFTGSIDDVRIYNYVLSQEEIAWLVGQTMPFDKPF
jgi:hypothetical protein